MSQLLENQLPLISRMLLERWKKEAPEVVTRLEESGQLTLFLKQANELATNLLYDLTIIQKRDYQAALEAAIEWSNPAPQTKQ